MRPSVVCGVVIVFILLEGVDCACDKFGDSRFGTIFIYENGTFRTDTQDNKDQIDATGITGITIAPGADKFGENFEVSKDGGQWVLKHNVAISGNNNRAPAFNSAAYSATITKLMPPDVPLHFVDSSLVITAKDGDFVCETDYDCNRYDDSNNVVSCFVEEDPMDVVMCEAIEENGSYRMFVSLKKTIDDITDTSYAFKLKAKDGGDPQQSSDPVTVTLNFLSEDLHPPIFSELFYSAEMITTIPNLPADIIEVSAVDGDPEIDAAITYTVLESSPPCPECFTFSASMLQLTRSLTQEMVLSRLVTVVVQATEETYRQRQSTVTVNIPIAGDDNNPKLSDFYQTELVLGGDTWTIETIVTFTPTDDDTMLENNLYDFKLKSDDYFVSASFQLSQAQGYESNLQLTDWFDIKHLPAIGVVSFFIEVSEVSDPAKSSRSMITVMYPPSTTSTTPAQETTTHCECPVTTECPFSVCVDWLDDVFANKCDVTKVLGKDSQFELVNCHELFPNTICN